MGQKELNEFEKKVEERLQEANLTKKMITLLHNIWGVLGPYCYIDPPGFLEATTPASIKRISNYVSDKEFQKKVVEPLKELMSFNDDE